MNQKEVEEKALCFLKKIGFPYFRTVSIRKIDHPDLIQYFVSQAKLSCDPQYLWEMRFVLDPPTPNVAESHGIASFILDPDSGQSGVVN